MDTTTANPRQPADPWLERLSDYLDGGMKRSERERFEAHLAGCAVCAATLAELREVVARAGALEDLAPAEDLWPAIQAQLTPRARAARVHRGSLAEAGSWWSRRFDLGLPQLAAAGVLLVALSAAAVWLVLRGPVLPGASGSRPGAAQTPSGPAPSGSVAEATDPGTEPGLRAAMVANPRYDAAVAELERALAEGRDRLDPRTLRVVEENLRIIDQALDEARRAVEADPGNAWLRSHLTATMQRKVDLLRSAAWLASVNSG